MLRKDGPTSQSVKRSFIWRVNAAQEKSSRGFAYPVAHAKHGGYKDAMHLRSHRSDKGFGRHTLTESIMSILSVVQCSQNR